MRKKKVVAKLSEVEAESGVKVSVGDDIVIDSGSTMPFVAKVQSVLPATKKKEKGRLKVFWYYFPEDTTGGRQVFHSKCEIFKSNHEDVVSTQSVMNTCKVLQLPQWCTYHAEGDSQRQAVNGPHNTNPFRTADADTQNKEPATNAKTPPPTEADAAASKSGQPDPPSPKAAPPEKTGKGGPAKGSNGADHRGKRKLPDRPAAGPNATARRVVAEPSPEPEAATARGQKGSPAAKKNGAAKGGKADKAEGKAEGAGGGAAKGAAEGEGDAEESAEASSEREASPMVFLCRHAYDAKRHKWVDEEVPLYCVCCMPYNPDLDMVECVRCGEWFHGECLGMNEEQFEAACKQDEWTCIGCSAKNSKARAQ